MATLTLPDGRRYQVVMLEVPCLQCAGQTLVLASAPIGRGDVVICIPIRELSQSLTHQTLWGSDLFIVPRK